MEKLLFYLMLEKWRKKSLNEWTRVNESRIPASKHFGVKRNPFIYICECVCVCVCAVSKNKFFYESCRKRKKKRVMHLAKFHSTIHLNMCMCVCVYMLLLLFFLRERWDVVLCCVAVCSVIEHKPSRCGFLYTEAKQ